jgi:hypothetical protein
MTTKAKPSQGVATLPGNKTLTEFNFELWAKQVRPQLLASLQKRGVR